jgi:hypothetical protein
MYYNLKNMVRIQKKKKCLHPVKQNRGDCVEDEGKKRV